MKKYLIGVDIGTSSVKAIVCDAEKNKIVASASSEHNLLSPKPGYSEEDPQDWWNGTKETLKQVLSKIEIGTGQILGLGTTGMLPAFVLVDEGGNVLRRSIQQSDARVSSEMEQLNKIISPEDYFRIAGCSLNQQMISPKILWMQKNEPHIFEKAYKIFGSYDYINYKLTGIFSVESNWALESGLYDVTDRKWSETVLNAVNISKNLLPQINFPHTVIGSISEQASRELGCNKLKGVPVIAGVADMISSAFISGVKESGDLLIKLGSAGDISATSDELIIDQRLFLDYHPIPGKYCLNGCMASSGSLLKWYKEQFFDSAQYTYKKLDEKISDYEPGSNGIVLLPYFIGEKTPIFDPKARGVIFGLTLSHNKYYIYRSILESIGFGFMHHIDVFRDAGLEINNLIASDAGASSQIWVQMLSDIFGEKITVLKTNPGSSLGAAFIAGVATNYYDSWDRIEDFIKYSKTFHPDKKNHDRYQKFYKIYRKLYENLKENFVELFEVTSEGHQ